MKLIDVKSLIIGILGTALVMVLMGHTVSGHLEKTDFPHFSIGCTSSDCFVIDTTNGLQVENWRVGGLKWKHVNENRANKKNDK